jgi:hypothetical protein
MNEPGEHFSAYLDEKAILKEHTRLYEAANREESKLSYSGDTTPQQLDRYLRAEIALSQWIANHPTATDKAAERKLHQEKIQQYTDILTGSYHDEKRQFCRERADSLLAIANEKFDDNDIVGKERSIGARKQAANWLRAEANCLTMPDKQPAQSKTTSYGGISRPRIWAGNQEVPLNDMSESGGSEYEHQYVEDEEILARSIEHSKWNKLI